jgi:YD repeat-containing protein
VAVVDRLGRRREFDYDNLGRRTSESWYTSGLTLVQTQTFDYDDAGNLTSATDPDGNYTITYDDLNRPIQVVEPFAVTLTFGYDDAGNRISVADSQGGQQTNTFDILNRLQSRTFVTANAEARFNYSYTTRSEIDLLARFADAAGTSPAGTTVHNYDGVGRVAEFVHLLNGSTTIDYDYVYDDAGRLTSRINSAISG